MGTKTVQVEDGKGNRLETRTVTTSREEDNFDELMTRAHEAIATLEAAAANWDTLTAAQRNATNQLAVRVLARVCRLLLGRFESA